MHLKWREDDHGPVSQHMPIGVKVGLHVELKILDCLQLSLAAGSMAAGTSQQGLLRAGQGITDVLPQLCAHSQSLAGQGNVLFPDLDELLSLLWRDLCRILQSARRFTSHKKCRLFMSRLLQPTRPSRHRSFRQCLALSSGMLFTVNDRDTWICLLMAPCQLQPHSEQVKRAHDSNNEF